MENAFYAQSGGATAVINATACGLLEAARLHTDTIGKVFIGRNGILGGLEGQLIDSSEIPAAEIAKLRYTPGCAFGSCRYKFPSHTQDLEPYRKLFAVFAQHKIKYFFYNGGGDSQDTVHKIAEASSVLGYPLQCIGLPKTIDNDLMHTDNCPGFGSAAKYIAVSIREAGLDVASMAKSSTKIFVMEVMGRHTGWLAAASGLAAENAEQAPHIILLPERRFDAAAFLQKVDATVKNYGSCAIVVAEGIKDQQGNYLQFSQEKDIFGHTQLGGVAPQIANLITQKLGYKNHWAICDYLQRAARHLASATDVEQAYALGKQAITEALNGAHDVMLVISRVLSQPYVWQINSVKLAAVANQERGVPAEFISADGMHITDKCREYLRPLIQGEDYPVYQNGLPDYFNLTKQLAGVCE